MRLRLLGLVNVEFCNQVDYNFCSFHVIIKVQKHQHQQVKVYSSVNFIKYPYNSSAMEQLTATLMVLMKKTALMHPSSPLLLQYRQLKRQQIIKS